ncbi:MAG: hypothetical protein E6I75_10680 [Chloroflexi bacterium]|nr:MAG: hypothetical protein E6I75_10680 [Chloroflexota bacterium]
MPEIASVASMPTAVPAPGAAVVPTAAAPAGAEPGTADFLAQLKAALKGLANAVVMPLPGTVSPPAAAQFSTSPDANVEPTQPPTQTEVAAKTDGPQPADMPEILAALGFVLVPTPLQPPAASPPDAANVTATGDGPALAAAQSLAAGRIQPRAVARYEADSSPVTSQTDAAGGQPTVAAPGQSMATPADALATAPADALARTLADSTASQAAPQPQSTTATASHLREMAAASSDAPPAAPQTAAQPAVAPQNLAEPRQKNASAASPPVAGAFGPRPQGQPATTFNSGDSSDSGDRHEHASSRTSSLGDSSTSQATAPASEQTFAATVASTSAPAQSSAAQPSQVVSQLAHQADLYRLPGNRGVRIQLHPDDLGGVQVTLRYAATGGLELYINVEHASTGALVQSGWTELRDALATQGISPDRLVMSVTGPGNASQLDFSSNGGSSGGGYRSESGPAGFMQGEAGQQRHNGGDNNETRTWRGWSGGSDPISSSDDMPRTTAPTAASRIDYRV